MAAGKPFIVPVVIDATAEARAIVPEEFMRVQWTRLPDGLPTPQFIEQVRRLIETPLPSHQVHASSGLPTLTRHGVKPTRWVFGWLDWAA